MTAGALHSVHLLHAEHITDLAFRPKSQLISSHVIGALLGLRAQVGAQDQVATNCARSLYSKGMMGTALAKGARGAGHFDAGRQLRTRAVVIAGKYHQRT